MGMRALGQPWSGVAIGAVLTVLASMASIALEPRLPSTADLNGTWTTADGTLISVVARRSHVEGRLVALSKRAQLYGWKSGDVILKMDFADGQLVGTSSARFLPRDTARCPEAPDHFDAPTELQLIGSHELLGRFRNRRLTEQCSTDEAWMPIGFKRQPFEVVETANEITIALGDAILFDFDRSDLKPSALAILQRTKSLAIDPQDYARIAITGHTDDRGSDAYNLRLSTQRAQAVAQWFLQAGTEKTLLSATGLGSKHPAVPNTSDANRARNRRVEIRLHKEVAL
jgi:outer membrane protein OmpA-like peptidoglycan-associated protein